MPSVTRQSDEHDDHDDKPNPIPEQRHDTYEDEVAVDDHQQRHDTYEAVDDHQQRHDTYEAVDDHQQQTDNSDDARDSEVINNIRYCFFINYYFFCYSKVFCFFFCNSRGQSSFKITYNDGWIRLIVTCTK